MPGLLLDGSAFIHPQEEEAGRSPTKVIHTLHGENRTYRYIDINIIYLRPVKDSYKKRTTPIHKPGFCLIQGSH